MQKRNIFLTDWSSLYKFIKDPKSDWKPKAAIVFTIVYLIWPIDLLPDIAPILGWLDDIGVTALAMTYLVHASNKYLAKRENDKLIQIEKEQE